MSDALAGGERATTRCRATRPRASARSTRSLPASAAARARSRAHAAHRHRLTHRLVALFTARCARAWLGDARAAASRRTRTAPERLGGPAAWPSGEGALRDRTPRSRDGRRSSVTNSGCANCGYPRSMSSTRRRAARSAAVELEQRLLYAAAPPVRRLCQPTRRCAFAPARGAGWPVTISSYGEFVELRPRRARADHRRARHRRRRSESARSESACTASTSPSYRGGLTRPTRHYGASRPT